VVLQNFFGLIYYYSL